MEFKILIIDQDQNDFDTIKKVFSYEGFDITVTNDPHEGRYLLDTTRPDLVVLDTGTGLSEALFYSYDHFKGNPVPCLLTFSDFPSGIDICGRCPDSCLKKPFGIKELLAKVRQVIREREQLTEEVLRH